MNQNTSYYALLPLLKSQSVHTAKKIKIYKPLIRPVAADGTESWALEKHIAELLAASRFHVTAKVF